MPRLVERIYAQIPPRLRGRLDVSITSDPYYLRVEVIVTGKDGTPYPSGPLDVVLKNGEFVDCVLPDWFIGHMCSIPVDDNSFNAALWDSLAEVELIPGLTRTSGATLPKRLKRLTIQR